MSKSKSVKNRAISDWSRVPAKVKPGARSRSRGRIATLRRAQAKITSKDTVPAKAGPKLRVAPAAETPLALKLAIGAGADLPRTSTKQARLIAMLNSSDGASIAEIATALAWQPHTVRGAIAGALKTRLGLAVTSAKVEGRGRVYRIED